MSKEEILRNQSNANSVGITAYLSEDGSSAYGYKKPFITESIEKINNFMEWNIKKDNNEL